LRVCLISNQIAAWGKIGGFGTATRALGAGLAKRGIDVSAVVVRRPENGQKKVEMLDGITVYGAGSFETLTSGKLFRQIDADIYQSQEPTIASYLAQRSMPERVHVVTCRDPRDWHEHMVELRHTPRDVPGHVVLRGEPLGKAVGPAGGYRAHAGSQCLDAQNKASLRCRSFP
jgi:hypothetical protein